VIVDVDVAVAVAVADDDGLSGFLLLWLTRHTALVCLGTLYFYPCNFSSFCALQTECAF